MIESHSRFIESTLVVGHNAVKSILFRLAEILLGVAVYKYFSFIAVKLDAFTSYLLFREDMIQKGLFVFSSKFSRASVLVLVFGLVIIIADLYGTLLWSLDAPGWHIQKYNTSARAIANDLLDDAGYVVQIRSQPGMVHNLNNKLPDIVGANFVKPGVNFTLLGENQRAQPTIAAPSKPFSEAWARIWLDDDGWSVSPDQYFTVASSNDADSTAPLNCPWEELNPGLDAYWNCTFDNVYAISMARDKTIGVPEIHWDSQNDADFDSRYIQPSRADNPWASLGTGGSTASLKQMFTVTKGTTKHTFIHNVFKATLLSSDGYKTLDQDDVTDVVKRTFSNDPAEQNDPIITMVVDSLMGAQQQNKSFSAGLSSVGRDGYSVGQVAWELLSPSVAGQIMYTMVRVSLVNITLWRTDLLPEAVKPFRPEDRCAGSFMNIATGGKVYDTDCYLALGSPRPRFLGEVDTSASLIVSGLLGYGRVNDSSEALNQAGYEWLLQNDGRLSELILSRGMIVGLSPDLVTVELSSLRPALSYLQLVLVGVALVLAVTGWALMYRYKYYTSSLLSILLTTADNKDEKQKKPGYMTAVPDIHLGEKGAKTMMAVPEGAFVLDDTHQFRRSRVDSQKGYLRAPAGEEDGVKWGEVRVVEGQVTPGSVYTALHATEYHGAAQVVQHQPQQQYLLQQQWSPAPQQHQQHQ